MDKLNNNTNLDDELLSAYVDGELTAAERAVVEARLKSDPAARELVAEIQALSGTLRSLPKLAATEDVRSAVLGQVTDKQPVALPEYRPGPLRRLVWPALAIAAALVLMFTQEDRPENGDLAKVEVRGGELRDQPAVGRTIPAFEAPETSDGDAASAPEAVAPAAEEVAVLEEGASAGVALGTELARTQPPVNGRTLDAFTKVDAELGIVHLTLTDLRSGTERFDRLLLSNGVQVLDDTVDADRVSGIAGNKSSVAADSAVAEATPSARALSAPAGGLGGAAPTASSSESKSTETEMVLVEAPPKQIEQILFGCNNDTEAIEAVSIDPSASGTNLLPEKQRLLGYQQYERAARNRAEAKGYSITPEQQGVISVLNSLPNPVKNSDIQPTAEPPISRDLAAGLQQQGWATKFRGGGQSPQLQQLETEVNNRRNQFYGYARQQQAAQLYKKLATKEEVAQEQPMRVLFLLHPSEQAAAQK
ncbi:MAG: zf-HC2 domain-containing protein [Bythopirellula sp.]|nr:zf-HC2 domain-containing protein [Bythopirellula sp.]